MGYFMSMSIRTARHVRRDEDDLRTQNRCRDIIREKISLSVQLIVQPSRASIDHPAPRFTDFSPRRSSERSGIPDRLASRINFKPCRPETRTLSSSFSLSLSLPFAFVPCKTCLPSTGLTE